MNIYFAGSIRGGRDDKKLYLKIIKHLQSYGRVLTEHVGDQNLTEFGEDGPTDTWIFDRDIKWLENSDVVVAEVTSPSLGVGYEIARAELMNKKILCLYRPQPQKILSAMITGCKELTVVEYTTFDEATRKIDDFLKQF